MMILYAVGQPVSRSADILSNYERVLSLAFPAKQITYTNRHGQHKRTIAGQINRLFGTPKAAIQYAEHIYLQKAYPGQALIIFGIEVPHALTTKINTLIFKDFQIDYFEVSLSFDKINLEEDIKSLDYVYNNQIHEIPFPRHLSNDDLILEDGSVDSDDFKELDDDLDDEDVDENDIVTPPITSSHTYSHGSTVNAAPSTKATDNLTQKVPHQKKNLCVLM